MRRPGAGLVVVPLVLAAVSVPMALGMIGPQGLYGFRTEASLASDAAWYASNRAAGWAGIVAGLAAFAVNLTLRRRAGFDGPQPTIAMAATVFLAAGAMLIAGWLALP